MFWESSQNTLLSPLGLHDWIGNRSPSGNTWTYNAVDELTDTDGQSGDEYTYDKLGNLEYKPDSASTPRTRYYYNGDNLLRQVDDVTGGGTTSTTITWDADSQRVKLARGSNIWEMIYDPTASNPAVLLAKNYVSSTTTYMFYVREPDGALLASFDAAETQNKYYYHFDDLGSAVLVTNGSGTASDSSTYGAWGAVLASQNNLKPYQYVGELGYYRHSSTQGTALANLLQLGIRFYDPDIGRFTQGDPSRDGVNWYEYAVGNPLTGVDPKGLACRPSGQIFWDAQNQRWGERQICDTYTVAARRCRGGKWVCVGGMGHAGIVVIRGGMIGAGVMECHKLGSQQWKTVAFTIVCSCWGLWLGASIDPVGVLADKLKEGDCEEYDMYGADAGPYGGSFSPQGSISFGIVGWGVGFYKCKCTASYIFM